MRKSSLTYFILGLLAIAICLLLAYVLQSAYLLFAASVLPLLILPYLPDFSSNQQIEPSKPNKLLQVYGVTSEDNQPTYVVIDFKPGKVHWNKKILYFSADHVALEAITGLRQSAIALPIYKSDLVIKKGKHRWVGIKLKNMSARSNSFSFSLNKVNRLVIPIKDIKELFIEAAPANKRTINKARELQA